MAKGLKTKKLNLPENEIVFTPFTCWHSNSTFKPEPHSLTFPITYLTCLCLKSYSYISTQIHRFEILIQITLYLGLVRLLDCDRFRDALHSQQPSCAIHGKSRAKRTR